MNRRLVFVFLLKNESFEVPNKLNFLNKLGENIANHLLDSGKYLINSDVQTQNFRSFLNYLSSDNYKLEINSDNYLDFFLLNNEFNNIISDIIMKPEFDVIKKVSILNILISRENEDKSIFEKDVAINLDFYLENYKEKVAQIPFNSLFNIFNHESRNLNNHEKAYQFIIEKINENNENKKSFCVLLGTLDATKMNEKSINESNLNRNEHFGFMPKSNDSFICTVNKNIAEMKNQIDTKFEQLFTFILNQQQQTFDKITQNIDEKLSSIEKKYELLSNKIEESKQSMNEIQQSIQQVSQKIENLNHGEEITNNLQEFKNKVNTIENSIQQVSQRTEIINNCTQLHFKIEHDRFNGIIHKLTEECGGNVHEKGIVIVESSSTSIHHGFDRKAHYAVDFEDDIHYFCSANSAGSWFKYNFKNKKVRPTHYSIKSTKYFGRGEYNLISWVIEGSNNDNDWIELDNRQNIYDLDGKNHVQTFYIQKILKPNEFFQYLRIRSTGKDSAGYNHILFSALEYFGSII